MPRRNADSANFFKNILKRLMSLELLAIIAMLYCRYINVIGTPMLLAGVFASVSANLMSMRYVRRLTSLSYVRGRRITESSSERETETERPSPQIRQILGLIDFPQPYQPHLDYLVRAEYAVQKVLPILTSNLFDGEWSVYPVPSFIRWMGKIFSKGQTLCHFNFSLHADKQVPISVFDDCRDSAAYKALKGIDFESITVSPEKASKKLEKILTDIFTMKFVVLRQYEKTNLQLMSVWVPEDFAPNCAWEKAIKRKKKSFKEHLLETSPEYRRIPEIKEYWEEERREAQREKTIWLEKCIKDRESIEQTLQGEQRFLSSMRQKVKNRESEVTGLEKTPEAFLELEEKAKAVLKEIEKGEKAPNTEKTLQAARDVLSFVDRKDREKRVQEIRKKINQLDKTLGTVEALLERHAQQINTSTEKGREIERGFLQNFKVYGSSSPMPTFAMRKTTKQNIAACQRAYEDVFAPFLREQKDLLQSLQEVRQKLNGMLQHIRQGIEDLRGDHKREDFARCDRFLSHWSSGAVGDSSSSSSAHSFLPPKKEKTTGSKKEWKEEASEESSSFSKKM